MSRREGPSSFFRGGTAPPNIRPQSPLEFVNVPPKTPSSSLLGSSSIASLPPPHMLRAPDVLAPISRPSSRGVSNNGGSTFNSLGATAPPAFMNIGSDRPPTGRPVGAAPGGSGGLGSINTLSLNIGPASGTGSRDAMTSGSIMRPTMSAAGAGGGAAGGAGSGMIPLRPSSRFGSGISCLGISASGASGSLGDGYLSSMLTVRSVGGGGGTGSGSAGSVASNGAGDTSAFGSGSSSSSSFTRVRSRLPSAHTTANSLGVSGASAGLDSAAAASQSANGSSFSFAAVNASLSNSLSSASLLAGLASSSSGASSANSGTGILTGLSSSHAGSPRQSPPTVGESILSPLSPSSPMSGRGTAFFSSPASPAAGAASGSAADLGIGGASPSGAQHSSAVAQSGAAVAMGPMYGMRRGLSAKSSPPLFAPAPSCETASVGNLSGMSITGQSYSALAEEHPYFASEMSIQSPPPMSASHHHIRPSSSQAGTKILGSTASSASLLARIPSARGSQYSGHAGGPQAGGSGSQHAAPSGSVASGSALSGRVPSNSPPPPAMLGRATNNHSPMNLPGNASGARSSSPWTSISPMSQQSIDREFEETIVLVDEPDFVSEFMPPAVVGGSGMGGSVDLGSSIGSGHAPPRIQTAPFSITVIDRPSHSAAPMRRINSSASGVGFKSAMNGPLTLSPTGLGGFGFVGSNGASNRNSGSGSGLEVVGSNCGLSAAPSARERAWSARTTKDLRPPSRQRPPPEALHLELPKAFVAAPAAGSSVSALPQQAMQHQLPSQQQPQQQQQNMFSSHGQAPSNLFAISEFSAERAVSGSSSHFAHLEAVSSASSTHSIDRLPSASKSRSGARMHMPAAGDGPT